MTVSSAPPSANGVVSYELGRPRWVHPIGVMAQGARLSPLDLLTDTSDTLPKYGAVRVRTSPRLSVPLSRFDSTVVLSGWSTAVITGEKLRGLLERKLGRQHLGASHLDLPR